MHVKMSCRNSEESKRFEREKELQKSLEMKERQKVRPRIYSIEGCLRGVHICSSAKTSWVNFTNVLCAAFTLEDPKSAKKTVKLSSLLRFWDLRA